MQNKNDSSKPGRPDIHIPSVLNVYQQCKLSLNFLQGAVDYWQNAVPFFNIHFDQPGARFVHNHWDQSENFGRWLYAATMARIVCGIPDELPAEKCWKQLIYQSIPEGMGLSYRPNPSPYDRFEGARDVVAEQGEIATTPVLQADLWDNRSVFTGLMLSYENTGDEVAFGVAQRMLVQLKRLAYWEGPCAYFRRMAIPLGWDSAASRETPIMGQNMGGWISPLVHYYKLTGDEEALALASGLARSFLKVYPDTLLATAKNLEPILGMNSHAVNFMLAGIVRLYRLTGETALVDWAKWQFDGILQHKCSEFGWTAEFMPFQEKEGRDSCETCSLVDRIDVGIQLGLAGYRSYWNDVQRCAVNYLVEAQLKDASWMPVAQGIPDDYYQSTYRIPERALGAYVGWGAPNDFVDNEGRSTGRIQNCCGAHGVFGCYQLWNHAVQKDDKGLHVNLHISCDTPWCSVVTHAPVHGKLTIQMKEDFPLRVRVPDWVQGSDISVSSATGDARDFQLEGDEIVTSGKANESVVIEYPMRETKLSEIIGGQKYVSSWVDDYVVSIEPRGETAPLFERDLKEIANSFTKETVWPPRVKPIEW